MLLVLLISCTNEIKKVNASSENKHTEASLIIDSSLNIKSKILNEDLLKNFVRSSNLQSPFFKSIEAKIESAETNKLRIQLFIKLLGEKIQKQR